MTTVGASGARPACASVRYTTEEKRGNTISPRSSNARSSLSKWNPKPFPGS